MVWFGENGKIMGSSVRADLTTTFVGKKIGLYINDGPEVNKRIKYSNLDIPEACFEKVQPILELTNESHIGQILHQRKTVLRLLDLKFHLQMA